MKPGWFLGTVLWLLLGGASLAGAVLPDETIPTSAQSLNGQWQFQWQQIVEPPAGNVFDWVKPASGTWDSLSVPGHWELSGFTETAVGLPSVSLGVYRREFSLPPEWGGRHIFLRFGGVMERFRVFVDGAVVGESAHPAAPVEFDITSALQPRTEHELVVWVAKGPSGSTPDSRRPVLSGIYRDVSLLAVPARVIDGLSHSTQLKEPGESALLNLTADLRILDASPDWAETVLSVRVDTAEGQTTVQMDVTHLEAQGDRAAARVSLPIHAPVLWNAESPYLYSLTLELKHGGRVVHRVSHAIGLRRIEVLKNSVYLNRQPIAFRGVTYEGYRPDVGYALSEPQWRQDLDLLKQANVNAVRLTGVLPPPLFFQVCDQMGLYVICDIPPASPSGIPSSAAVAEATNESPQPDLPKLRNAVEPIQGFRIYTSLLGWGVTPEEGLGRLVPSRKEWDPSRFLAGTAGSPVEAEMDVLTFSPPDDLKTLRGVERPWLLDSVSGVGLDALRERLREYPNALGTFLPAFPRESDASHPGVLPSDRSIGLMYRQAQRAYSPVWIEETVKRAKPGRQVIELRLHNDFDFTNLSEIVCHWQLKRDTRIVREEDLQLSLPPRQSMGIAFPLDLPADFPDHEYQLALAFARGGAAPIAEHSVWLQPDNWEKNLVLRLRDLPYDAGWSVVANANDTEIRHADFTFHTRSTTAEWFAVARERNMRLVVGGPYLLIRDATEERFRDFWVEKRTVERRDKDVEIQSRMQVLDPVTKEPAFRMQLDLLSSPFGFVDVRFSVLPEQPMPVSGLALGFDVPSTLNRLSWLGRGPWPSLPGMEAIGQRGIYQLELPDGSGWNRSGVNLLALTEERGGGVGIVALDGNLSWEASEGGFRMYVHSWMPESPLVPRPPAPVDLSREAIVTAFRLVFWGPGQMPAAFRGLLPSRP